MTKLERRMTKQMPRYRGRFSSFSIVTDCDMQLRRVSLIEARLIFPGTETLGQRGVIALPTENCERATPATQVECKDGFAGGGAVGFCQAWALASEARRCGGDQTPIRVLASRLGL